MMYEDRPIELPIDPPADYYGAVYGDWYADNEDKLVRRYCDSLAVDYQTFLEGRLDTEKERVQFCSEQDEAFDDWCEREYQNQIGGDN